MKRYLSDAEYIRSLHGIRNHSPVIDELCERLEGKQDAFVEAHTETASCPACEAVVTICQDPDDDSITLKLR